MPHLWNGQINDVSTFSSALKLPLASFQLETLIRPGFLTQRSYEVVEALLGERGTQNMWKKTSLTEDHQIYVVT